MMPWSGRTCGSIRVPHRSFYNDVVPPDDGSLQCIPHLPTGTLMAINNNLRKASRMGKYVHTEATLADT